MTPAATRRLLLSEVVATAKPAVTIGRTGTEEPAPLAD
jgi:hypothetical protein